MTTIKTFLSIIFFSLLTLLFLSNGVRKNTSDQLPTATPTPDTVTLYGAIEYTAKIRDGGTATPVTNPLPRVRIEVWDDTGSEPLGKTWVNSSGEYIITVPNNEPGGIDPKLFIYADDKKNNTFDTRVEVVNPNGISYFADTPIIGNNLHGTHRYDYTINLLSYDSDTVQAFLIFDKMANVAYNTMQSWVSWNEMSSVKVIWPKVCVGLPGWLNPGSCYFYEKIYMHRFDGNAPDIIIHEYGHFVLSRKVGNDQVVHACSAVGYNHTLFGKTNETCAWSEGWADFFEMAVQNDADYVGTLLDNVESHLPITEADKYEFIPAASLWDFYDVSPPEPWDEFHDGFNGPQSNGIWYFSTTDIPLGYQPPATILTFWNANWPVRRPTGACYGSVILNHHLLPYPPYTYTLTTEIDPLGAGTVSTSPAFNCPQDSYQE
jgi:hypothetical protein